MKVNKVKREIQNVLDELYTILAVHEKQISRFEEIAKDKKDESRLLISMVKDLEDTQELYFGYPYVRTIRNILIGKEDALIAPCFTNKEYYGLFERLTLEETEEKMDRLVNNGLLDYIFTKHGKLYCTHEWFLERR